MCGRYVHPDQAAIERAWHLGREQGNPFAAFERRFNVTPTSVVPVLRADSATGAIRLMPASWGFIPHWWKDAKPPRNTINARSEEAAAKPMWRTALQQARCLLPAEGWYEWRALEQVDAITGEIKLIKQPYFIRPARAEPLAFAGLWSARAPAGAPASCAILTRASVGACAQVHDRMPVVLPRQVCEAWLNPALTHAQEIQQILRQAREDFECIAVSTQVNARGAEGEQLIQPLARAVS